MSHKTGRVERRTRPELARAPSTLLAQLAIAAGLLLASCTVALRREHDQCQTSADCQALSVGAICTSAGICEPLGQFAPNRAALRCQTDADCDGALSVCRQHSCRELEQAECRVIAGDGAPAGRERLPIGVLVPPQELADRSSYEISQAVTAAINDVNATSTAPLPWVLAVACAEDNPAGLTHLLDQVQVSAVVGTTRSDSTAVAMSAIANKALLFAPFADAPLLDIAHPAASLVSCRPNRNDYKASLLSAIDYVRARQSADQGAGALLALSNVEGELGFDELYGALVHVVAYDIDPRGSGLADALAREGLEPDWVVAPSGEADWSINIGKVDSYLRKRPPSYLLSDKQQAIVTAAVNDAGSKQPLYQRVLVLDDHLSPENLAVHGAYASTLKSGLTAPTPGEDYVRDCAYLSLYAADAAIFRFGLQASDLRPAHLLVGLRALVEGEPLAVGQSATVLEALSRSRGADRSMRLIGGSGDLDLSGMPSDGTSGALPSVETIAGAAPALYVRPSPRVQELSCIDPKSRQFCGTGITFPAQSLLATAMLSGCSCND